MKTKEFIQAGISGDIDLAKSFPDKGDKLMDGRLVRYVSLAMEEKLLLSREKGRGGWWDSDQCTIESLRTLLSKHINKGDMIDVINIAGMIYVREIGDSCNNAGVLRGEHE